MKNELTPELQEQMACTAYESVRGYGIARGEWGRCTWQIAMPDLKDAFRFQVGRMALAPGMSVAEIHEEWRCSMAKSGWQAGSELNRSAKTHPWLVGYEELSGEQKMQYHLCKGVVEAFRAAMDLR